MIFCQMLFLEPVIYSFRDVFYDVWWMVAVSVDIQGDVIRFIEWFDCSISEVEHFCSCEVTFRFIYYKHACY